MMEYSENQTEKPILPPEEEPKKTVKEPKKISLSAAIFLALFLCIAAFIAAYTAMSVRMEASLNEMDAVYSKYAKLEHLLGHIDENYVREYDEDTLWNSLYKALLDSIGDPYTTYMTAEEYAAYKADRSGSYVGIGISVTYDAQTDGMYIYRTVTDSPASRAGLRAGDVVVAVGDISITKDTYDDAFDAVRGESGTDVTLTVLRGEETLQVTVTRGEIQTENVMYEVLENKTAYITILSFSESVTYDQFAAALEQAGKDGCTSYIFDVRNNPGGDLEVICKCLDLLLPEGIIVNIVAADGTTTTRESSADTYLDAPMVVLCNGSTASAAELFTADLRDFGLATLVGETTYGKGTMQTISPLSDGSAVKLTTRYYNPSSNISYDGIGIVPDKEVVLTEEENSRFHMLTHEEDRQLQAALEILKNAE